MQTPDDLARNVAAGVVGPGEIEWLKKGFATRAAQRGSLPLERCLGLPATTPARLARDERDLHLMEAWRLVDGDTPWKKSVVLAAEVKAFQCRIWKLWKDKETPPETASGLRRNLFWAMRVADRADIGVPSTDRQIHNIAREFVK